MAEQPSLEVKNKNSYSVWVEIPPEARIYINKTIKILSDRYDGPIFEPHITLVARYKQKLDRVVSNLEKVAEKNKPFQIELGEVDYGNTYFQAAFQRVRTSKDLLKLRQDAQDTFDFESFFVPHVSLFYGNIDLDLRERISKEIKLKSQTFETTNLIVVPSGLDVPDPNDWDHLATVSLGS